MTRSQRSRDPISVAGLSMDPIDAEELIDRIFVGLAQGEGGWILTPNVDLVQQAAEDPEIRALYQRATLRVADGVPLLWLASLQGQPLPGRAAGSDLVWRIADRAAREGRSLFLLGGDDGVAERAAERLCEHAPGLRIVGCAAPRIDSPPTEAQRDSVAETLRRVAPDIVYVAFGSPKTEWLIDAVRVDLPRTWLLGCGISLSFISGDVRRAPGWMQRVGMEWAHRLSQEPGRLAHRYMARNLPFLVGQLWSAIRSRGTRGRS